MGGSRILAGEDAASLLFKVSGVELLAEGDLLGAGMGERVASKTTSAPRATAGGWVFAALLV